MTKMREIDFIKRGTPTRDGAGVRLTRVFGHNEAQRMDPFLLLDLFGSDNPDEYMAGFPWHPHRGIETITYVLHGEVAHEDSLGNAGVIGPGDVQWMTAGSGIIHQEMPRISNDLLKGFQLWANLPSAQKMTDPKYRDVRAHDIPVIETNGAKVRVVAGHHGNATGPVQDVVIEPEYLDISLEGGCEIYHEITEGHTAFAFVFDGNLTFGQRERKTVEAGSLVVFTDGNGVLAHTDTGGRFLLISGKPIGEPIAWRGPIVMNTTDELDLAVREYREGTFIKHG